jgi:hypothetical protein
MPDPNVGQQVAAQFQKVIGDKPEDNIFKEASLLMLLEKNGAAPVTGGRSAIGTIEYAVNTTVAAIADTDALTTTRIDVFDEAEYAWKEYAGTFVISTFEEAINRGASQKIDLLAGKAENLRSSMRNQINIDAYGAGTAFGGKAIGGLALLVPDDPTLGTRGGISAVTYTFWRSQQTLGTKTTNAYDNLRSAMRTINLKCSNGQGDTVPTHFLSDGNVVAGYEALLVANERIVSKADSQANAGFDDNAFMFKTAKVVWDFAAPAGKMYALRFGQNGLRLSYQTGHWFKAYPAVDPANQLIDIVKVETICQMVTFNPRHLGVITVIT